MYGVSKIVLTKRDNPSLFAYFTENGILATNLHNAALFRVRQNFTLHGKEVLSENEKTILKEMESTMAQCHAGKPGS